MPSECIHSELGPPGEAGFGARMWASAARLHQRASVAARQCAHAPAGGRDGDACRLRRRRLPRRRLPPLDRLPSPAPLLRRQADPGREGCAVPQHCRGVHQGAGACRGCSCSSCDMLDARPAVAAAATGPCWLTLFACAAVCSPRSCSDCWSASRTSSRTTASSRLAACTLRRHARACCRRRRPPASRRPPVARRCSLRGGRLGEASRRGQLPAAPEPAPPAWHVPRHSAAPLRRRSPPRLPPAAC